MKTEWKTLLTAPTPGDDFGPPGEYVLRERTGNAFNWSTHWHLNDTADHYYVGNYFDNKRDAVKDFMRRAQLEEFLQ